MALKSGLLGTLRHFLCCSSTEEGNLAAPDGGSELTAQLGPKARAMAEAIFKEMDLDGNKRISKAETIKWWGSFAKINTKAMFDAVDADVSGEISMEEWLQFWTSLLRKGRTEEDVLEELEMIQEKISWAGLDYKPEA